MFDDIDVTAEHERVLSGEADDDLLRLENLSKVTSVHWRRNWGEEPSFFQPLPVCQFFSEKLLLFILESAPFHC